MISNVLVVIINAYTYVPIICKNFVVEDIFISFLKTTKFLKHAETARHKHSNQKISFWTFSHIKVYDPLSYMISRLVCVYVLIFVQAKFNHFLFNDCKNHILYFTQRDKLWQKPKKKKMNERQKLLGCWIEWRPNYGIKANQTNRMIKLNLSKRDAFFFHRLCGQCSQYLETHVFGKCTLKNSCWIFI